MVRLARLLVAELGWLSVQMLPPRVVAKREGSSLRRPDGVSGRSR